MKVGRRDRYDDVDPLDRWGGESDRLFGDSDHLFGESDRLFGESDLLFGESDLLFCESERLFEEAGESDLIFCLIGWVFGRLELLLFLFLEALSNDAFDKSLSIFLSCSIL